MSLVVSNTVLPSLPSAYLPQHNHASLKSAQYT
jgi:hypothetical protein